MAKSFNPDLIARLAAASHYLVALRSTGSFTRTAEQFGVHQTALSHRLRALEDALGQKLFLRTTRSLSLTPAGEAVCRAAEATLGEWTSALERITKRMKGNRVHLSLPSSLAMKWLVPALPRAQVAGIDLSLAVDEAIVSPSTGGADAAIRFGPGPYPGYHVTLLARCEMWPVTRPGLVQPGSVLDGRLPDGLRYLMDSRGTTDGTGYCWQDYFAAIERPDCSLDNGTHFERADLMLQAAISGMGVALGRTLLVESDVSDGFLQAVGLPVPMKSSYWFVTTAEFAETDVYRKLVDWLGKEVAATRELSG